MLKTMKKIKKLLIALYLISGLASRTLLADDLEDLQKRLAKINNFHAYFSQICISEDGSNLQEGSGELWMKRPNFFKWHIKYPEESVLVTDGKTLWFYDPFVEQVTATWLKDTTEKILFMLITHNNTNDWKQYQVEQKNDEFRIIPKSSTDGNMRQFAIEVTKSGIIRRFSSIEPNGQRSIYTLKIQKNSAINTTIFTFIPPPGAALDDQRR